MTGRATEAECEDAIVKAAMYLGWRVHAERAAKTKGSWRTAIKGDPGYVDLTMVHRQQRRIIFAELKRRPNKVEPEQQRWLDALAEVAAQTPHFVEALVVWVPEDMQTFINHLHPKGPL